MNLEKIINQISENYGYDNEINNAIKILIPQLVNYYGEERLEDIINLFQNTRIFATDNMNIDNRKRIENIMINGRNLHIKEQNDNDPYQESRDPGAYYSYAPIYDKDMNVTNEVRWVVVQKDEKYKNLFNTNINMPYFTHEICHALNMQNPIYKKQNDTIYSKHGMYETYNKITKDGELYKCETVSSKNIIFEEMINEYETEQILITMLNKNDYNEVKQELHKINHVPASYSEVLMAIAEQFVNSLNKKQIFNLRAKNDMNIKNYFNQLTKNSSIYKKYSNVENPYDSIGEISYKIFELSKKPWKLDLIQSEKINTEFMLEALSIVCSYREMINDNMNLDKYTNAYNGIMEQYSSNNEIQAKQK